MKFTVTMKDPDALHEAVQEAAKESLEDLDLSDDEKEVLLDKRAENLKEAAERFFEFGEYVQIEIDTKERTATLLPYD